MQNPVPPAEVIDGGARRVERTLRRYEAHTCRRTDDASQVHTTDLDGTVGHANLPQERGRSMGRWPGRSVARAVSFSFGNDDGTVQ